VIAEAIDEGKAGNVELIAIYDLVREHAEKLVKNLVKKPVIANNAEELLTDKRIQLVIEAASQKAVKQYAVKALSEEKDIMVLSTGALLDDEFFQNLSKLAEEKKRKIFVPSGAILGLDNVKSAVMGHVDEVTLITRKPPLSFEDSSFVKKKGIDLSSLEKPLTLYDGSAREAVKLFPQNVNVSATLSLAGIGPDKTRVKIIIDPEIKEIIHEIHVKGDFGEFWTRTINKPFPTNPKTSYIAALSAITTLKRMTSSVIVGT